MFATVQFETLSTELKERMRSPARVQNQNGPIYTGNYQPQSLRMVFSSFTLNPMAQFFIRRTHFLEMLTLFQ